MPKNCSVPHCKTKPGDRKSFYKFPLHDPERLHLWLRNMGQDNWTPSRHHYICNKHFAPSNFKVCWDVRYLKKTAVPTLFQKKKVVREKESRPKHWTNNTESIKPPGFVQQAEVESSSISDFTDLGEIHQHKYQNFSQEENDLLAFKDQLVETQSVEDLSIVGDCKEMVFVTENREDSRDLIEITDLYGEKIEDITYAIVDFSNSFEEEQTTGIAVFEIIPNLITSLVPQLTFIPETFLSSALTSQPITSTVPIVSKYTQSSKVKKSIDSEEEAEDDIELNNYSFERQQEEEHCYHKNSKSKEQLEATVVELQRKVRIMQQSDRKHLDKLEELEKTVTQLSQSKLLYEERLQCLERAYLQANVNPEEIVTFIYEDESPEYICTNVPNECL